MASERSADIAKAEMTKGATLPSPDHPQRLHLHRLEKPTPTLEAWLDAGVLGAHDDDGEECVSGHKKLPTAYQGCTKESVLVEATKLGVWIWPVRFDIGVMTVDGAKPWTLYHYTCEESFEAFAKGLSSVGDAVGEEMLARMVLDHLQADFKERDPVPGAHNTKGDLELCSTEPGMFRSKKEIRKAMLAGRPRPVKDFDKYADYCIPVRVPGSACRVAGGGRHSERLMVTVSKETLDALRMKAQANAAMAEAKRERAERATSARESPTSWGCFGFVFGGAGKPSFDEWEEDFTSRKRELAAGQDVVDRPKREVGHKQKQMRKRWIKEHFASRTVIEDMEETRRQEEQRRTRNDGGPRVSAKAESALHPQSFGGDSGTASGRATLLHRMSVVSRRVTELLLDNPTAERKTTRASQASKMYLEFHDRTEGNKQMARGALTRMKTTRSERATQISARQSQMGGERATQIAARQTQQSQV